MTASRVRWRGKDGREAWLDVSADPGPGSYADTVDGLREVFRQATIRVRTAAEAMAAAPLGDLDGVSAERAAFSAASAEWKAAKDALARYEAFLRVHPGLTDTPLSKRCQHVAAGPLPTCYTGPDDGWYRAPVEAPRPERTAGADDDDETPVAAASAP